MNKIVRLLLNYFFKGVLVIVPLALSIYVIWYVFRTADSIIDLGFPGSGILISIAFLTFVGLLLTTLVTEPIYNRFDKLLNKVPLFKLLYTSVRDLLEAFVGEDKKFNEPVLVEMAEGIKQIGFLTQKDLSMIDLDGKVAVYFPLSYSIAGRVLIVNKNKVEPLNMKASDAMKFVVSGGVSEI